MSECEIGEAESIFNRYILKSESVPKAIFLSWSFLEENRWFYDSAVGPCFSCKVLVPNVEYVLGHFFM
jgi:hypothetical protein